MPVPSTPADPSSEAILAEENEMTPCAEGEGQLRAPPGTVRAACPDSGI